MDYNSLSDEDLDARIAQLRSEIGNESQQASNVPILQSVPATEAAPDYLSMSDEELDGRIATLRAELGQGAQSSLDVPRRPLTREERIARNNAAIERALQPGEGEMGFWENVGQSLKEGARGAARAVKDVGEGFVGMASGAVRLAGTPIRALTGWDGLHRAADAMDSGYANWGADALMSDYGENPDGWGFALGRAGEKVAGVAGSLAGLGAAGRAVRVAGGLTRAGRAANAAVQSAAKLKAAGKTAEAAQVMASLSKGEKVAETAMSNFLPAMFGNDAAVRTYDAAVRSAEERGEEPDKARALGLASVNGAIHFLGFKAFENQSLNKMLGMPQTMEVAMPAWANAARAGEANTFSGLVNGVRNGMFKYILAERAKGALKAGGIMGLQNFLSSIPTQMAEGAEFGDVDWERAIKEGAAGVGEGALMEGLMGGAAALKTPAEAKRFISDVYFRKGYRLPDGQRVPGLLHSEEGRRFIAKQNPEAQRRILDIVSHGGDVSKEELDAACLPTDMSKNELKRFARDWYDDLSVEEQRTAEPEALGEGEELEGNENAAQRMGAENVQRQAEAEMGERLEHQFDEANAKVAAERAEEEAGAEQLAREEAYPRAEPVPEPAPAEQAVVTKSEEVSQEQPPEQAVQEPAQAPVQEPQASVQTEPDLPARNNRLRRRQPNFRHPQENTQDETGPGTDEAPAQPEQVAAEQRPEAGPEAPRPVAGEPPRAESPDAGVVAEAQQFAPLAEGYTTKPGVNDRSVRVYGPDGKFVGSLFKDGTRFVGSRKLADEEIAPWEPRDGETPAAKTPPAEPAKNAPASAPSAEGTTAQAEGAEASRAAGSAAGKAAEASLAAERPKAKVIASKPVADGADTEEYIAKTEREAEALQAWGNDEATEVKTGEAILDRSVIQDGAWVSDDLKTENPGKADAIIEKANRLARLEMQVSANGKDVTEDDRFRLESARIAFARATDGLKDGVDFGRQPIRERVRLLKKPLVVDVDGGWDEPDSDFASEDTKIKGRKVSNVVKAAWADLMEEAENDVGGEGLSLRKLTEFAKEHGFDGLVLQGLHDPKARGWSFDNGTKIISFEAEKAPAGNQAQPTSEPAKPAPAKPKPPKLRTQAEADTAKAEAEAEPKQAGQKPSRTVIKNRAEKVGKIVSRLGNENPDAPFASSAFRYSQNNPGGLNLGELEVVKDLTVQDWQQRLGLSKKRAEELRKVLNDAFAEQRAAAPNNKRGKANEAGQDTYSVAASMALDALSREPGDLKLLAKAYDKVDAAIEAANRQGDSKNAGLWTEKHDALIKQIGELSDADQAKVMRMVRELQTKLQASETKDRQSLETREDKTLDVAMDDEELDRAINETIDEEQSDASRLDRIAESDDDATGTSGNAKGGRVAEGSKSNPFKGYEIVIKGVDGDKVDLAYYNADGDFLRTETVSLDELKKRGETIPKLKALAETVERLGDDAEMSYVRLAKEGQETKEQRDARFAADEDYQKWLKKRGANDAPIMREKYEFETAKDAKKLAQNRYVGTDIEALDREYRPEPDGDGSVIEDGSGRIVGTFNRSTGKVRLFRGANFKTLVHELDGHATLRYAEQLAERGDRTLLDRINKAIDEAPEAVKEDVRKRYPQGGKESDAAYAERLRDEIWAAVREGRSDAMKAAIKTLQGKAWYNRAWQAIKDAWKGMLAKMGFNRVDLSGIDKMSNDEFLGLLDRTLAEGRTMGRLEKGRAKGTRPMLMPETMQKIRDAIGRYKTAGMKFTPFTESIITMLERGGRKQIDLPGFESTPLVIESPATTQGVTRRLDLDHSAFNHNWEAGTAYTGYFTWPEFDRAFRDYNLRNIQKLPNKRDGQELWVWRVKYPKTDAHEAYELTWQIARDEKSGKMLNLYTTREPADYPPMQMKSPEGEHFDTITSRDVADSSSSGDSPQSVSQSAAEGKGANEKSSGDQREARAPRPAGYSILDDKRTTGEKLEEKFIDSHAPVRTVQEEIGGVQEITRADGYTDHTRSTDLVAAKDKANGRVEHEMRELQHKVDGVERDIAGAALDGQSEEALMDDFNLYLSCKHAAERNRAVAKDRGDDKKAGYKAADYYEGMGKVDYKGSLQGLSENLANQILSDLQAKYGAARMARFEDAARKTYKIAADELKRRYDAGLLSKADYDFYHDRVASGEWEHYVPLKTDRARLAVDEYDMSMAGSRLHRSEYRKAKGRGENEAAIAPFTDLVLQAEQGIRKSINNEVAQVEANLVELAHRRGFGNDPDGNPLFAEIVPGDDIAHHGKNYQFTFGDGSSVVSEGASRLAGNHPEVHLFKRDGKLYAIRYRKGANGRGLEYAKAASGENMGRWGEGLGWIPRMTHWMSAMRTQYSPEFTVSNWLADSLEAAQALVGRYGIKGGLAKFGRMIASEVGNFSDLRAYLKDGTLRGDVREAILGGLLTKGGVASEGYEGTTKHIRSRIEEFRRKQKRWREMTPADWAKSGWKNVAEFLSFANEMAEYSTRMGIFSALRKSGVPVSEAVKFARDATVNFNRKGTAMPYINGLYMFANASVQGAVRSVQAMRDTHGKQLIGALVAVGVAKAVIDNFLGNDDERERKGGRNARNQSEYDKKHNVGVPIGGGKQFVPLRFRGPYAAIPYIAQTAANVAMGATSAKDGAKTLLRELGDQVTDVVGGNGVMNDKGEFDKSLILQSLAPSVADPMVQLATGKDYKGDDRLRRSFSKTAPVSWNGKRNTGAGYKAVAEFFNMLSGGNENRKGLVDIAPEDLQLIAEFIGGGPMRDINNAVSTVGNLAQFASGGTPERTLSQAPFLRRIVREYPESTSRYYGALDEYEADKAEFKGTTDPKRRAEMRRKRPYLTADKGRVDNLVERVKDLTHLERGEIKRGQKWVEPKMLIGEKQRERYRNERLRLQAQVLKILGK